MAAGVGGGDSGFYKGKVPAGSAMLCSVHGPELREGGAYL